VVGPAVRFCLDNLARRWHLDDRFSAGELSAAQTINPITHTRLVTPGETARLWLCANSLFRFFLRTEPSHNLVMLPVKHSRRGGVLTQRA